MLPHVLSVTPGNSTAVCRDSCTLSSSGLPFQYESSMSSSVLVYRRQRNQAPHYLIDRWILVSGIIFRLRLAFSHQSPTLYHNASGSVRDVKCVFFLNSKLRLQKIELISNSVYVLDFQWKRLSVAANKPWPLLTLCCSFVKVPCCRCSDVGTNETRPACTMQPLTVQQHCASVVSYTGGTNLVPVTSTSEYWSWTHNILAESPRTLNWLT